MAVMAVLDIGELMVRFPDFRVGLVVAAGLAIPPDPPEVRRFLAATEAACRAALGDGALADIPELRCWREANKAFGVKKTSYRSSVERLLKGAQRGAGLPRVNALVDLYNAVSAAHRMPVGADDLDLVRPALELLPGRPQRDRADDRPGGAHRSGAGPDGRATGAGGGGTVPAARGPLRRHLRLAHRRPRQSARRDRLAVVSRSDPYAASSLVGLALRPRIEFPYNRHLDGNGHYGGLARPSETRGGSGC